MLERKLTKPRIGLYGVGLKAYWPQFDGLERRLIGYTNFVENKLSEYGDVYNFGLVDDEMRGRTAGEFFNSKMLILFLCIPQPIVQARAFYQFIRYALHR